MAKKKSKSRSGSSHKALSQLLRLPEGQVVTVQRQNRAVGESEQTIGDEVTVVFNPLSASLLTD